MTMYQLLVYSDETGTDDESWGEPDGVWAHPSLEYAMIGAAGRIIGTDWETIDGKPHRLYFTRPGRARWVIRGENVADEFTGKAPGWPPHAGAWGPYDMIIVDAVGRGAELCNPGLPAAHVRAAADKLCERYAVDRTLTWMVIEAAFIDAYDDAGIEVPGAPAAASEVAGILRDSDVRIVDDRPVGPTVREIFAAAERRAGRTNPLLATLDAVVNMVAGLDRFLRRLSRTVWAFPVPAPRWIGPVACRRVTYAVNHVLVPYAIVGGWFAAWSTPRAFLGWPLAAAIVTASLVEKLFGIDLRPWPAGPYLLSRDPPGECGSDLGRPYGAYSTLADAIAASPVTSPAHWAASEYAADDISTYWRDDHTVTANPSAWVITAPGVAAEYNQAVAAGTLHAYRLYRNPRGCDSDTWGRPYGTFATRDEAIDVSGVTERMYWVTADGCPDEVYTTWRTTTRPNGGTPYWHILAPGVAAEHNTALYGFHSTPDPEGAPAA